MTVQDLINQLSRIDPNKNIGIIVNLENSEDPESDIYCEHAELWDNGSESIDLFIRK